MHTNLQNTPSGGPLTVEDLDAYRRGHVRRPYIPLSCDQQSRYPEAAHAASEYHDDEHGDSFSPAACALVWLCGSLAAWAGVIALALALWP